MIQHTKPIPVNTAQKWRRRLSILYLVIAWNFAGMILYKSYDKYWSKLKSENLWPSESGTSNLRTVHISGMTVVKDEMTSSTDTTT